MEIKTQALTLDLKKIDETKHYILQEIKHNEFVSKKRKTLFQL